MASPTFKLNERRWGRNGVSWVIIEERPHRDGAPAYVRARSDSGKERTFHWFEWARFSEVPRG